MNEALALYQAAPDTRPVLALSTDTKQYLEGLINRVTALGPITTDTEFRDRAADLNAIQRAHKFLDDERLKLARQYDEEKERNVNAPAKPLLDPLKALKLATSKHMGDWDAKVEAERRKRQAEQDAERAEAQRLALEAERRKELGAQGVEKAKTEAQFEAAATQFDKGVAVDMLANETLMGAAAVPLPEAPTAKGVKRKMKVEGLEVTDLAALPITYHAPDEKKLKAHILDGTLKDGTPGLRFRLVPDFSGTGR